VAQVAVCSQINTKHIKTVWAERTVVEYYTVGASRNQSAVKGQSSRKYTALSSESLYWQQNNTKRSYEYKNIKDL